jgi:hypothetical protein
MKPRLIVAASFLASVGVLDLGGCAHFHERPLLAEKSRADFDAKFDALQTRVLSETEQAFVGYRASVKKAAAESLSRELETC